jgi:hypothetical protein
VKVKGSTKSIPAEPVEPDRTAENVRMAPTGEAAWAALGTVEVPLSPLRRQLNDEAMAIDHKIAKGWSVLAEWERGHTDPPPAEWVDRLVELHAEQLDKLFDLDRVRVFEAEHLGIDVGTLCAAVLNRASVAFYGYWVGHEVPVLWPEAQAAFEQMCKDIDMDDAGSALERAKEYVASAVRMRYAKRKGEPA